MSTMGVWDEGPEAHREEIPSHVAVVLAMLCIPFVILLAIGDGLWRSVRRRWR